MQKKYYDLLEDGRCILSAVPAEVIREYIGMPNAKMVSYTKGKHLAKGRYQIMEAGEFPPQNQKKKSVTCIPSRLWEEWEAECSRFRGYTWTKERGEGVKVLCRQQGRS